MHFPGLRWGILFSDGPPFDGRLSAAVAEILRRLLFGQRKGEGKSFNTAIWMFVFTIAINFLCLSHSGIFTLSSIFVFIFV